MHTSPVKVEEFGFDFSRFCYLCDHNVWRTEITKHQPITMQQVKRTLQLWPYFFHHLLVHFFVFLHFSERLAFDVLHYDHREGTIRRLLVACFILFYAKWPIIEKFWC